MAGGGKKHAGIGVLHVAQEVVGGTLLHHVAPAHHGNAVCHVGNNSEIMGDHQKAHLILLCQLFQQVEDLRLRGHVQRGGRLIRDQQQRAQGDGHGNHHALTLATAEFMRIAGEGKAVLRQTNPCQGFGGALFCRFARHRRIMDADRFRHLRANGLDRVQRGHGFLKHHAHVVATHAT